MSRSVWLSWSDHSTTPPTSALCHLLVTPSHTLTASHQHTDSLTHFQETLASAHTHRDTHMTDTSIDKQNRRIRCGQHMCSEAIGADSSDEPVDEPAAHSIHLCGCARCRRRSDPRDLRSPPTQVTLSHLWSTHSPPYRWDFIFFTGSERVGSIVSAAAAKHCIPTVTESTRPPPIHPHLDFTR